MSERDIPALQHNPHWLMNEPDLLPRFDMPAKARARTGARMPPATGSGYEQIIAARAAMRARADRATGWRASIDVASLHALATGRSTERPPLRARRRRPGLAVAGLLAAPPACFLLAFVWFGPARSPIARVDGPTRSVQASLPIPGTAGAALPTAGEEGPEFAIRDRYALPRVATAEAGVPEEDASPGSASAGAGGAAPTPGRDEPMFAAQDAGVPRWAPGVEPGTPEESVPSRSAPAGAEDGSVAPFAEEEPAFAAWNGDAWPRAVGVEPDAAPNGASPAAASRLAEVEPGSAPIESEEPVLAARHQDAPARAPGAGSGALHEDEPAAGAAGAELATDASATDSDVWTAPEGVPSASAAVADATELGADKEATRVPATAASVDQEPAPGADPALASLDEPSPATAPPARPTAAAGAALAAASVATAAGASAHAAPVELPARPAAAPPQGRVAASAALPPAGGAPPTKLRPGETAPPASRVAARDAPRSSPSPDPRCRAIVIKAQLGEETSHAERSLLRSGCGARR